MRIDFYLIDAMEIDSYFPVWQALRKKGINAQMVAAPPNTNTVGDWFDYQNAIKILNQRGIPYTETPDYDSVAITTQAIKCLHPYRNRKYRLMYGVSMFNNSFCNTKEASIGFDGILVHGKYSQSKMCQWRPQAVVPVTGYPKYDRFFKGVLDKNLIRKKLGLSNNQVILYLPTWSTNSLIDEFAPALKTISQKHQLMIKPHHCTARMDQNKINKLKRTNAIIIQGNHRIDELLAIADVIIADAFSGAFTEALLTNVPVIGLFTNAKQLKKKADPRILQVAPICTNPSALPNMVETAMHHDKHNYSDARNQLKNDLFACQDGTAGHCTADAILDLITKQGPKKTPGLKIKEYLAKWRVILIGRKKSKMACFRALRWLQNSILENEGVKISNRKTIPYPEITGYVIPTLYQWGEKQLAIDLAKWLISQQNLDGSFSAPDGTPYTFDTGQALRGLLTILNSMPEAKQPIVRACDYIISQILPTGEIITPSKKMWGNIADDRIHLYILPPLIEAGKRFHNNQYIGEAARVLQYYKTHRNLTIFDTLSHFNAYIIDALCDLGEQDLAKTAMKNIAKLQKPNGSIPAYANKSWVCSPGVAQFAVIWYKLGQIKHANQAMKYLEQVQNKSGGFYGCYGWMCNYFPREEISWAVKFFLDAYYLKIKNSFNEDVTRFPDKIDENDGRIKEVISFLGNVNDQKVIDVGCGKGRFLKVLQDKYPQGQYYGLDISEKMLAACPQNIKKTHGSILNIPYPDNYFDNVLCIETLEHAVNINGAIKELARILKPGGKIIVIDKNNLKQGKLATQPWEKWFKPHQLKDLLTKHGVTTNHKQISYEKYNKPNGLFIAWEGVKNG